MTPLSFSISIENELTSNFNSTFLGKVGIIIKVLWLVLSTYFNYFLSSCRFSPTFVFYYYFQKMDVNDHGIEVRSKAIGMLKAGLTMKIVAEKLDVSLRSVQRWSRRDILGKSMETLPRNGRPKILSCIPKIIISKTLGKRGKSTRTIACNLVNSGYTASHSTVNRYLRNSINVYPYKRQQIPRLTEKMKQNRLNFALKHKNWTVTDWQKVLWSDESPF